MSNLVNSVHLWEVRIAHYESGLCSGKTTYTLICKNGELAIALAKRLVRERFPEIKESNMVCEQLLQQLSQTYVYQERPAGAQEIGEKP